MFFFQAEDGIRDKLVTGVQTCALPIFARIEIGQRDDTGDVTLTYFNARKDFLEKLLPVGERRIVSGTTAFYDGMLQMVHPDRVVVEADLATLPLVEPVYPLTEGLGLNIARRAAEAALARAPVLPEWQE